MTQVSKVAQQDVGRVSSATVSEFLGSFLGASQSETVAPVRGSALQTPIGGAVAVDTSRFGTKPDLGHERTSVLQVDAVRLQTIITQAKALLGAARALHGDMLTTPGTNAFVDFENGMSDVITEIEGTYDSFDLELEGRS